MKRSTRYLVTFLLCLSALGCELAATFDRDKIPRTPTGAGGKGPIDSGVDNEKDGGMDAAQDASPGKPDANGRDAMPTGGDALVAEAGRDAGPDAYIDANADAQLGCPNDDACPDEQYCTDNTHACVSRLATGKACTRDRQCTTGGGCCQSFCVSLSQEAHCGTSAGDNRTTCGDQCASDQYCDNNDSAPSCKSRLANDAAHSCSRDRQCADGGGCCKLSDDSMKCVALNQNAHCGISSGDDNQTCGTDCTAPGRLGTCIQATVPGCGCGADDDCTGEQYCSNGTCLARLVNDGTLACTRDRQCATGGGCCGSVCTSLSQNNHCGATGCGANCTAEATDKVCFDDGTPSCVQCNVDGDCATGSGCCNHVCVSLRQNGNCGVTGCGVNCTAEATNKVCVDVGTASCVQCNVDGNCAANEGCCNHVCVSLAQNDHCGATGCGVNCAAQATDKVCFDDGTPSCGCTTDGDCATGSGCCSNVCVSLNQDNHCGTTGCGADCASGTWDKKCIIATLPYFCGCAVPGPGSGDCGGARTTCDIDNSCVP